MLVETGMCKGIENYSRYLSGQKRGEPPPTLFQYLPPDALLFVDESHATLPQVRGMYNGDYARKKVLSDYGFRLPSAMDNRPLKFEEFDGMRPQTVFVSATPGPLELGMTGGKFVEQVIRPTGLIDPPILIRPASTQVDDLLARDAGNAQARPARAGHHAHHSAWPRSSPTTWTKPASRCAICTPTSTRWSACRCIRDLRLGTFDVLVGVNLLREGLDIPECG